MRLVGLAVAALAVMPNWLGCVWMCAELGSVILADDVSEVWAFGERGREKRERERERERGGEGGEGR